MQENLGIEPHLNIGTDPGYGSPTLTVSGPAIIGGTLTAQANAVVSGNLTVAQLATLGEVGGGVLSTAAQSLAAGGTVTVGSNVRVVRISVAAIAGAINMPTDTVDGRDLTVINVGTAALTLVTNVAGGGKAIASGASSGFSYDVTGTLWYART